MLADWLSTWLAAAISTVVIVVLGSVGWALWYLARRDGGEARQEATEATSRARIAETAAAAAHAGKAAAESSAAAANAQVRVVWTENNALRRALADARSTRPGGEGEQKVDDLYDSTSGRLRAYPVQSQGED